MPLSAELKMQWADTRDVSEVSAGSRYIAQWKCSSGHEWHAAVYSRTAGRGCPFCSGARVLPGFNDLGSTHPELAASWRDARPITGFSHGSNTKVLWACEQAHTYLASPASRAVRGRGCPICTGKQVLAGYNDIPSQHPALAAEWNDSKDISDFTSRSGYRATWKCGIGHIWKASIANRVRGSGCPVCNNRQTVNGFNDLLSTHPELASEWDDKRDVSTVTYGSDYVASWKCSRGHRWAAAVANRSKGRGCPVCSNQRVDAGTNSFSVAFPLLRREWDDAADSESFAAGSGYRAWWKCDKGHRWQAQVKERTNGTRCPICVSKTYVSLLEQEVVEYVRSIYDRDIVTTERSLPGLTELDIFLPEARIGIEVNGLYYHSEAFKAAGYHKDKQEAAAALGIQLVEVWEDSWRFQRETVMRMLAHKIGVSKDQRVPGRKTKPSTITLQEARTFLNEFHLQGWASGSYYLGLRSPDGSLVAVMVLKRAGNRRLRLERYATSAVVAGGQSKLLRYAEQTIPGWDSITTFADASVSDGHLYESTGWSLEAHIPPDYSYLVAGRRRHKFGYRLERFRSDPTLSYREGATERELAAENGLLRIWDSGKTRYVYHRVHLVD